MKMYKEMLRKTAVVGIPLLAITMVYTLVNGGQSCFGYDYLQEATSAVSMVPILRYYVFTAVIFALYGFSFQFSRPGSDVYHSLPVKRTDLYLSVLLATATWMGGTIILNVLEMLAMLLISGCPFVPAYVPMSILFYFVAAMMVYGASAIGCALSGTIVTALASTGMVLLLPRFVQFIFARGISQQVPIIGWLDFGALLNPTTNIATGLIVMNSRQVYISRIITMPHILYSMLPMVVMLVIGWWLYKRRPSEIAHKNNGSKTWSVIMSILLAFAVMLPITMRENDLLSVYGGVLIAAALAVFFLYQLIVTQNFKSVLKTLPFFLVSVCLALGVSLLIDTAADNMLNTTPQASEIESVTFRGYDETAGDPVYSTGLTRDVAFTDDETKEYVAQALQTAVVKLQSDNDMDYYEYNAFKVIEPVTIKLTNGKTVKRTIEFMNVDELNELRMANEEFAASVRAFPPLDSVQFLSVNTVFTDEENEAVLETYVAEATQNKLFSGYYYRSRSADLLADGSYQTRGTNQSIGGFTAAGYVGTTRYQDNYTVRLDAPQTVSLIMRTYNAYAEEDPFEELQNVMERFLAGLAAENDSMNVSISTYNYPSEEGQLIQEQNSFYLSRYTMDSEYQYDIEQQKYMKQFVDLLSRATKTDDPTGVFIRMNWYYYDSANQDDDTTSRPTVFLHFENETDEQEYLELIEAWDAAQVLM